MLFALAEHSPDNASVKMANTRQKLLMPHLNVIAGEEPGCIGVDYSSAGDKSIEVGQGS